LEGFQSCGNLQILDISGNEISNSEALRSCKKLRRLFHTHPISDLTEVLPKLQMVNTSINFLKKPRVLIVSLGINERDTGVWILAKALIDGEMEPIYIGLKQTPDQIIDALLKDTYDVLGLVILSGEYASIIPDLIKLLEINHLDDILIGVGGNVSADDIETLRNHGISQVFLPGSNPMDIIDFIKEGLAKRKKTE
ncbi:MAG: cobalamin B12-binding domain-containing protein, partial [Candidatus Lokiarchaeota archaeon]|nr:cobalamin B12-binding domain-containing protein [Candidatus Lokiarchaeota archaeon]